MNYKRIDGTLLDIRPQFNLKWYKNEDLYSEGAVEDKIIDIIIENEPEKYTKAICEQPGWSTFYHLTHLRRNILDWYDFREGSHVLEIGCGMGAITGLLCDKAEHVTAVELSKRRAEATLLRCREKNNLEIIVGNLNDIEFSECFDYITLIGVLEYQVKYTDSDKPFEAFLDKIKSLLKPDGRLIIAIENKFGLKYWCGAPEDHSSMPFDSINQYAWGNKKAETFSRKELDELLETSGFKDRHFYYPLPDYKLPEMIYSDEYLPVENSLFQLRPYIIPTNKAIVADEKALYNEIIRNGVFPFFANSFLVECSIDQTDGSRAVYALDKSSALEEFRAVTIISNNGRVYKHPQSEASVKHISKIVQTHSLLSVRGVPMVETRSEADGSCSTEYIKAPLLRDILIHELLAGNTQKVYEYLDKLYEYILLSSDKAPEDHNIIYQYKVDSTASGIDYGPVMKTGYVDLVAQNCFLTDEGMLFFDQEWILENLPARYILWRSILTTFSASKGRVSGALFQSLLEHYNLVECNKAFGILDESFYSSVLDLDHIKLTRSLPTYTKEACMKNAIKLLSNQK